jgi:hypothetical protein
MVVVASAMLVFAGSATACSCAPQAPGELLRESDAAIVGRLVEVMPRGALRADYRYEVLRVYSGRDAIERGQMLTVRSARRAAACALPRSPGHRYGLFLVRDRGRWFGGICSVIAPRRLWRAVQHQSSASRSGAAVSGPAGCPS